MEKLSFAVEALTSVNPRKQKNFNRETEFKEKVSRGPPQIVGWKKVH